MFVHTCVRARRPAPPSCMFCTREMLHCCFVFVQSSECSMLVFARSCCYQRGTRPRLCVACPHHIPDTHQSAYISRMYSTFGGILRVWMHDVCACVRASVCVCVCRVHSHLCPKCVCVYLLRIFFLCVCKACASKCVSMCIQMHTRTYAHTHKYLCTPVHKLMV
jgi:hypothetical protein